jgi:hypothetical protein
MILFIKLFLAHLLGDFICQRNTWVAHKEAKKHQSIHFYFHLFLHGILAVLFVGEISFIPYAFFIAITHGGIDLIQLNFQKKKTKRTWFIVDQAAHIVILIAVSLLYQNETIAPFWLFDHFWILITGLLFITQPTSIFIKTIISIWSPENDNKQDNSLANAGNYIGILERLFVFCFIITGHFEAIGFLLAAKSIFRFGDLKEAKDRKLTEYVLIGTLLSFGMAILTGFVVQALLL